MTSTQEKEQAPDARNTGRKARRRSSGRLGYGVSGAFERFGVPIALIILIVLFSLLRSETFATGTNARAILGNQAVVAMLSLAVMVPLIVGEFDLSLASALGWLAMEFAVLLSQAHVPVGLAAVIVLLTGACVGLFNAFLVLGLGINSFIGTLATGTILVGGSLAVTNGTVISTGIPASLNAYGSDSWGMPLLAWSVIAVGGVLWYLLRQTPVGRFLYATGGNRSASRLAGIHTTGLVTGAFVLGGVLAGCAGLMSVSYSGSASPTSGPDLLLPAFAAVFLGATTIDVGRFNVIGTLFGVLLVGVGVSGLQQLGLSSYVAEFFNGAVLIVAVALARAGSISRAGQAVSGAQSDSEHGGG